MPGRADLQADPRQVVAPLLVAPAVALTCFGLTHWSGMPMTADGWAQWQGAVSLMSGHGYSYFSGHPITSWPPLYPLYLGLWTAILGPTGLSLVVSQGVLVALQAFLWIWLFLGLARDRDAPASSLAGLMTAGFVGLLVCRIEPTILAHDLVYTLLPLLLWSSWRLAAALGPSEAAAFVAVLVVGVAVASLLLLAHNAAAVFVASAAAVVATQRRGSPRSIAGAACLAALPCLVWLLGRSALGQSGSHHIGWAAGKFGLAAYVAQLLDGVGTLLLPSRAGLKDAALPLLLIVAVMLCLTGRHRGLRFGLVFTIYALLATLAVFSVTFVADGLSDARFSGFVPLILLPLVFLAADRQAPRTARTVLLVLLGTQVYWTALATGGPFRRSPPVSDTTVFLPLDAYIDPTYRDGPPVATDKGILVAPIGHEESPGRRR